MKQYVCNDVSSELNAPDVRFVILRNE